MTRHLRPPLVRGVRAVRDSLTARILRATAVVGAAAVVLAGCTDSPTSPASTTPAAAATTRASGPSLSSTPFSRDCADLAPTATVEAAYPGMAPTTPVAKPAGDAGIVADNGGTVCTWKSADGKSMTLTVGQFASGSLTEVKNGLVTSSNSVPTYGVEGYFLLAGTDESPVGVADAFSDPYWIVASSDAFLEPGDAQPLVAAAVASLGA